MAYPRYGDGRVDITCEDTERIGIRDVSRVDITGSILRRINDAA
jgi:hypothetical protein